MIENKCDRLMVEMIESKCDRYLGLRTGNQFTDKDYAALRIYYSAFIQPLTTAFPILT